MKYLIGLLVLFGVLSACQDEEEIPGVDSLRPVHSMRVKKISGNNDLWKDYTLEVSYVNNKVADIKRYSKTGREVGGLSINRNQETVLYELLDYVPAIDADSIIRLDKHLAKLYGEGNYLLEDSIPLTSTRLMTVSVVTKDGIVTSQQFTYYQPKTDFGTGREFDPSYDQKNRESLVYEYDAKGRILVCRSLSDVFDPENTQVYTRTGYKTEYEFQGNRIAGRIVSVAGADYEGNWKTLQDLMYHYNGANLTEISGNGYTLARNYAEGKLISIVEDGVTTLYTMNEQDLCIKVEDSKGGVMNIEYETGSGDFEIFTPLERRQQGFPVLW